MLQIIDYVIIVAYFILTIVIGLSYSKKAGKDLSGFFLGGRGLSWFIAGISMVATTFAADTPLAVNELVVKNGISGNWLWWNFLAGGMLTTFFFANLWRRSGVMTEVELIELRYSGQPAAILRGFKAVYLGLFINAMILGWVNVAMISILKEFFDLTYTAALYYTAAAMVFVAIYSSISGLLGVAITDAVQFVIAMTGCIILAYIVVNSPEIGGIDHLKETLNATHPGALSFFPNISNTSAAGIGSTLAISMGTFCAYLGVQWWASWYPGAEPGGGGYIAQRMMSTKTEKDAIYATLFFQVAHYCIRPWAWILVGLCAIVLYPNVADKKLGYIMAMKQFLPPGLKGLLLVAFFAAYMSTIATQLNWGASYIVNDLYHRFLNPKASNKQLVLVARLTTLALMVIGLAVSTQIDSISGVWSFLIECGAGLGLVLILRWYWWRINAWSEIAATITPIILYTACKWANVPFPASYFITVGITTVVWIAVTFLTKPTNTEHLKAFYTRVRPDGAWEPIQRITTKVAQQESKIGGLLVCWLSAVALTYAILFGIGDVIFKEWTQAGIWAAVALVSFAILRAALTRTKVLAD